MPHQITLFEFSQNWDFRSSGGGVRGNKRIVLTHSYDAIISLENLCLAWQEFIRGKRNKRDVQEFGYRLMNNIIALHEDLANKTYQHGGYHSFRICDPKPRHIHKASVRDRLLHHAIYRILYPFFDRTFTADSFSCRDDKGTHKALNRLSAMAYKVSCNHTRTCFVLKCDIRKFFASIEHAHLLGILQKYIPDQDIIWLLGQVVRSFHTPASICHARPDRASSLDPRFREDDAWDEDKTRRVGLPLGNLTSQLFANVYMNEFDHFVKHRIKAKHYIRYADDFVILHEDRQWLETQISSVEKFLQERLRLQLHPDKVTIKTFASGIDFLGWVHFTDHRVLRSTTRRRMMRRLRAHPAQETLQSYLGLLRHGNTFTIEQQVRMLHWLWGSDTLKAIYDLQHRRNYFKVSRYWGA